MTATRRTLLLLLLPLLFLLLLLTGAELYLRQQKNDFRNANKNVEKTFRAAETPGLIYERIPHTAETNNHGFRGQDYAYEKADDVWRIVVVGDSIAQGHALPMEDTFGKHLEWLLNDQRPPEMPRVEVYVVAETGYNTAQQLVLLEEKALQYDPDLIIWSYCLNDPAHALFHNESNLYSRYFHQPPSLALHELQRRLFKLRERFQGLGEDPEYHRFLHTVYGEQVQRHIRRIATVTKDAGVPVLLLIVPVLEVQRLAETPELVLTPETYGLLDVHTVVARMALQNGLDVVEGLDAFVGSPLAGLIISPEDMWHPNAAGHEMLALQLQKHLLRHGPWPDGNRP